ncbi:hypothetical protein CIG75_07295 [Tumebacillus algifaecis]|uniref:Uncharacterized protein n=1 Tax=Tumebacillus algifaecis TaxID=1214604 RepID=A0A223CZP9_9BACL|nr:hypothetical protein [Tumebacillus algifaecis]ASS74801.1 hypothetical protein CIG75_07295 [Tumebacillus algifaecis]
MYGWKFPLLNHGQIIGLNDSGVETFRNDLIDSLAREIIQNSCDARDEQAEHPVEVHFELLSLPTEKLPGRDRLIQVFQSARLVWAHLPDSCKFFDHALDLIQRPEIPMLKISDYQTTGLTGAREEIFGSWNALVKSSGVSDKPSQAGGSFGIGKNAPFACTRFRTIYYGTKDTDGVTAFQGVAKLVSHEEEGELTQGTGFFGRSERNLPLLEEIHFAEAGVDPLFTRTQTGTDIFIPGFQIELGWEVRIIRSVLEHFFVSIKEGRLVVCVGSTKIDTQNLEMLLHQHVDEENSMLVSSYYQAYKTPVLATGFEEPGDVELYLLSGKELPKRIAMFRSTGMKIQDKRFNAIMPFSGVFIAKGKGLNEFLRKLEPPNHQSWEWSRFSLDTKEQNQAKKRLERMYNWIKNHLRQMEAQEETQTLEVEGMSQFLPDNHDESFLTERQGDGMRTVPTDISVRTVRRQAHGVQIAKEEVSAAQEDLIEDKEQSKDNGQEIEVTGGTGPSGEQDDSDEKGGNDGQDGSNQGSGETSGRKVRKIKSLKKVVVFCVNPMEGIYQLIVMPDVDGVASLSISVVGEDSKGHVPVLEAKIKETGDAIAVAPKGKIGPFWMKSNQNNTLLIRMNNSTRYRLEVTLHAN